MQSHLPPQDFPADPVRPGNEGISGYPSPYPCIREGETEAQRGKAPVRSSTVVRHTARESRVHKFRARTRSRWWPSAGPVSYLWKDKVMWDSLKKVVTVGPA